jgi:hypothetical protein
VGLITLRSDALTVSLDPDRGGEITAITAPERGNALSYHDWPAPLEAGLGPSYGSSELDWLSKYRGGWQFLFPNSGSESHHGGIPVAFHGEASLAPVVVEHASRTDCTIRTAARLSLVLRRTVRLAPDEATVFVEEEVTNVGITDMPFVWGHHPTFPAVTGARIDLPDSKFFVEPSAPGDLSFSSGDWPVGRASDGSTVNLGEVPSSPMVRLLYLYELSGAWAALRPPAGSEAPGIAMSWDHDAYPFLWLWLLNADPGFPWFGRAKILGIEPQRAWPFDGLAGAVDRGQAQVVEAGKTVKSWMTITLLPDGCGPVVRVDRLGGVIYE